MKCSSAGGHDYHEPLLQCFMYADTHQHLKTYGTCNSDMELHWTITVRMHRVTNTLPSSPKSLLYLAHYRKENVSTKLSRHAL